jgi:hypothetical protein
MKKTNQPFYVLDLLGEYPDSTASELELFCNYWLTSTQIRRVLYRLNNVKVRKTGKRPCRYSKRIATTWAVK